MTRHRAFLFVLLGLWACSTNTDNSGNFTGQPSLGPFTHGDPVDLNGDDVVDGVAVDDNGDGALDGVDLDGDGEADALLPGQSPAGSADNNAGQSPAGNLDGDASPSLAGNADDDAGQSPAGNLDGNQDGGDGLVIEIPVAKVACGSAECEIKGGNVCCESWLPMGFGNESLCITEDECVIAGPDDQGLYEEFGRPSLESKPRAVVSTCDGAEDCATDQICCYVRRGRPLSESIPSGPPWTGPGAGRSCMPVEKCLDDVSITGLPTGMLSCNDNEDCETISSTTCQSEQSDSATTGKGVEARAGAQVCR